jgi:quinol monooxygenase YgiN
MRSGCAPGVSKRMLRVMNVLTIVTADVDQARAEELIAAYEMLLTGGLPDGLLQTQLLGDGQGHWAIHSMWRDRASLDAMRAASEPPAAPALFRRFSAEPALAIMSILVDSGRQR